MKLRFCHNVLLSITLILIFLSIPSCSEDKITIQPPSANDEFDLFIDFQKGFYNDSVEVYLDDVLKASLNIKTNQYTRFAERIELDNVSSNQKVKIILPEVGKTSEITLQQSENLTVNYNRYLNELEIERINYSPQYDSLHVNEIQLVDFITIVNQIWANIESPLEYTVRGHFEWQAVNKSVYRDINGIENVFADLYSIKYNTDWLTLLPVNSNFQYSVSSGDTIDFYMQLLEFQGGKVDSFCNSLMKVEIAITDSYNNIRYLTIDSLKLVCVE